jgi:hypothetical protein
MTDHMTSHLLPRSLEGIPLETNNFHQWKRSICRYLNTLGPAGRAIVAETPVPEDDCPSQHTVVLRTNDTTQLPRPLYPTTDLAPAHLTSGRVKSITELDGLQPTCKPLASSDSKPGLPSTLSRPLARLTEDTNLWTKVHLELAVENRALTALLWDSVSNTTKEHLYTIWQAHRWTSQEHKDPLDSSMPPSVTSVTPPSSSSSANTKALLTSTSTSLPYGKLTTHEHTSFMTQRPPQSTSPPTMSHHSS